MTLDEAIKHAEEVAEKNEKKASWFWGKEGNPNYENCVECAEEHRQIADWLKELKQLKEQEPCEDCVSRQAVIDIVVFECGKWTGLAKEISKQLGHLPSVTPQPKMGRWIDEGFYAEGHSEHAYRCSECDEHYIGYMGEFKHCPNCGAKMKKESEEE